MMRGTVWIYGTEAERRIVLQEDVPSADAFRSRVTTALAVENVVCEFGPIGEPWSRAHYRPKLRGLETVD